MFNISAFLNKFAKLGFSEQAVVSETKNIIQDVLRFTLDDQAIRFKNGIIYISAAAAAKNEIFFHKKEILEKLTQKIQQPKILDIK